MHLFTPIRIAVLGVLLACVLLPVGCGEAEAPAPPPAPTVTVAPPVVRTEVRYHEYTGNTAALNEVDIVARVPGVLIKQNYDLLGDDNRVKRVEENEVLFEIEHEPYQIAVDSAAANVKKAEALEKAAKATFDNVKRSFERGAAADNDLTLAEADYNKSVAERLAAQAQLAQAELNLSYTFVKSPIAGEVSRNLVDVGTYVGGGGPTVLTRVTQVKPIYVYFDVSETIVQEYINRAAARGEQVADNPPPLELATSADAKGTYSHTGTVDWWDRTVDRGTGTIVVRGRLENEDGSLVPGLFVRVRVPFEEMEEAVLVPESAIGTDLAGKHVMIVGKNEQGQTIALKQPVTLLMRSDDGLRVVEGLAPDAQVIVNGLQRVRPNMPIQTKPAQPEAAAPTDDRTESQAGDETGVTPTNAPDGDDA